MKNGLVTKLRLKPPSELRRSVRESSLLGGRCAAAKTASKATLAKTCFISPEQGFRRCLGSARRVDSADGDGENTGRARSARHERGSEAAARQRPVANLHRRSLEISVRAQHGAAARRDPLRRRKPG